MSIQTISYLKNLWVDGYIPTGQDYTDLFDTVESFKDDDFIVNNGDGTYTVNENGVSFVINTNFTETVTTFEDNNDDTFTYTDENQNTSVLDLNKYTNKVNAEETDGGNFDILLGVLRNTGGVWSFIDDSGHSPSGFGSVVTNSDNTITVNFGKTYNKVKSFNVTTDETYASRGYIIGSSVSVNLARIYLYKNTSKKDLSDYVYYDGVDFVSSDGVFNNITYSAGVLTIIHDTVSGFDITATPREGMIQDIKLGSNGDTRTQLYFYNQDGTQYTGVPDTNMRMYISRGVGDSAVEIVTHSESNISYSNLWVMGVMEY